MATVVAGDPHQTQHYALLRDMYQRDLVITVDIPRLASYLASEGAISHDHAATVANCGPPPHRDQQLRQLCDYLAASGNSNFSSNRHLIRTFNNSRGQDKTSCEHGHEDEGRPPVEMAMFAGIQYTFLKQLYHSHRSSSTVQHRLKWLTVDVDDDSIDSYFPPAMVQGLCGDETSISLASLLRATRQVLSYCMKHETSSLKAELQSNGDTEQLSRELARSQKEYARITQLWEQQCEQLQDENAALRCQLDEAEARSSSNKLQQEVQDAGEMLNAEVQALKKELEEDKNYIEELKDQVANYKLNAKLKEPTVREFAHILESKRHLETQLEELTSTNQCLEARNQSLEKEMASLQEEVAVLCEGRKTMMTELRESNDRILALKLHLNGSNGSNKEHYTAVKRETANNSKVYSRTEQQCPVCQQVFHTLSDGEFTCHVAGCFK